MADELQIYVLGSPVLQIGKRPLTADLISLKGQALLIYLAVTGQPHTRTTLAGLLWGDLPEESARANLRLTLSKLRKFLPKTILHTTRLNVALENAWLDATEFEKQLNTPAHRNSPFTIHHSPFSLYRGDFLTGFDLPNAPEFEIWSVGVRQHLRQTAVSHLYQLVETAVVTQQTEPGIAAARQLLTIEPWHEEAHRQLMQLLAADGQRSAAIAQYETCRRLLAEELGVEPSRETTALYQQILNDKVTKWQGDQASPVTLSSSHPVTLSPLHNLPPQFTPFIGRSLERQKLTQLLQNGRSRLITLLGEGGVGKTRLALAAAEQLLPHFPDGVWFVPLADLETAVVEPTLDLEDSIASAIAAVLELNFAAGDPPKQQLVNYLCQRQALLILDNFEPLLEAAGLALALLANAPRITLLATSREPLKLQAEHIFKLEGLALPEDDGWETAVTSESVQLFAERAERASGQSLLTPENLPLIVQLCRFVNGLPLGIELMTDWTRWLSLSAIAADLQTNLLHLERSQQDVPERHRSLQAVFAYSWQMLSTDEKNTLAQLSVFRGGFQLEGMRAVTNSAPSTLFSLIDKSLVQHQTADYYNLHDLLRTFAQAQLAALPIDLAALKDRHARHYLARLARRTPKFFGPEPQKALVETQAEAENLLRAWQWAGERPLPDHLLPAVQAMGAYWNYAGLFLEGEKTLRAAIQQLPHNGRLLAALANEHAALLFELTWLAEMKTAAETTIHWSKQVGDEALEANGHLRLGQYHWRSSSYQAAAEELTQAEQLAQKLGLINLEGIICRSLAANAWRQADLAAAQQLGERSAKLHQQANDIRSLHRSHFFLAILAFEQQQIAAARTYTEPLVAAARTLGDRLVEISGIGLLGSIAVNEGKFEQAVAYLSRRQQMAEENGRLWDLGSTLGNLGDVWLRLGQFEQARESYTRALTLFRQIGTLQGQSNVLAFMGFLAAMQGDFVNGRSHCQEALQLAQQDNARREQAYAHTFLAHNLLGLNQLNAAQTAYAQAVTGWQQLGDMPRQMEAQAGMAQTLLLGGDFPGAVTAVAPILAYLAEHELNGANDPVQVYLTIVQVLTAADDPAAATWLHRGQALLNRHAAQITNDELRAAFLSQIPSHREISQQRELH